MDKIDFKGKRVLVTGGNGYLGSHLVTELEKCNAEVFVIDFLSKGRSNEFNVDITDKEKIHEIISEIRPHLVFHLAAILNRERGFIGFEQTMSVNFNGTLNLLLALRATECEKFIFTSTSEVYGGNVAPFTEDMVLQPVSPYSITKSFAETVIRSFSKLYNKNYTILRVFNFYGDNMPSHFFISDLIESLKTKDVFKMTKGEQARDYIHVSDVIQALILSAVNSDADKETFNVCSGKSVSLLEMVVAYKEVLKSDCILDIGAIPYRENEIWNMVGDNSKIKEKLGFKVNFDISNLSMTLK